MTESEAYAYLTGVFRRVFRRNDIELFPEMTSRDLYGWDSLKQVDILMEIEQKISASLSTAEVDSLRKVDDLAQILRRENGR